MRISDWSSDVCSSDLIDIATGTVAGCEALIRWLHPEHGLIPPGNFLPVAEEFGLMGAITRWVLDEALRQVGAWRRQGLDLGVSVNMPADMLNEQIGRAHV